MLVVQTGGTIDKHYPKVFQGNGFEIGVPAALDILSRGVSPNSSDAFKVVTVCAKDSQLITNADRDSMAAAIIQHSSTRVIITHGTDTMILTGQYLAQLPALQSATIVLTGALTPAAFKNTDADFNFGMAVGAAQCLAPGVFIAMHGTVAPVANCTRDPHTGRFVASSAPTPAPSPVPAGFSPSSQLARHEPHRSHLKWRKSDGGVFYLKHGAFVETNERGEDAYTFSVAGECLVAEENENRPCLVLYDKERNFTIRLSPLKAEISTNASDDDAEWSELIPGHWEECSKTVDRIKISPDVDPIQNPPLSQEQLDELRSRNLPEPVIARNFKNIPGKYLPFVGRRMSFLVHVSHAFSLEPRLTLEHMTTLVEAFDAIYDWFAKTLGQEPTRHMEYHGTLPVFGLAGNSQIGACCGWVGATGVEMSDHCFVKLFKDWHDNAQIDQALPYEFGRNFLFSSVNDRINYKSPDSGHTVSTGFAVFMRFMALRGCGLAGAPFRNLSYAEFLEKVRELLTIYNDTDSSWDTTLRPGKCPPNEARLSECDLWASFMLSLCDLCDENFLVNFYKQVKVRPAATNSLEAVDNLVVAASKAAGMNLIEIFRTWRWPVSDQACAELIAHFHS
eukprot:c17228_g1_i2.p1 GENE.c17228_g1_i2~~c17228_g1_i2.p1  ORF type:complete len:620 (+),score=124.49 c17228_g1_i2:20-1879(+)